jgi:hypothetical protein
MFDPDNLLRCDFCENGTVTKHIEQIKFRQLTDRGYIFCRAEVPIGICSRCSSKHWNKDVEAMWTISSDKNTKNSALLN